jgi:hypothetical protein
VNSLISQQQQQESIEEEEEDEGEEGEVCPDEVCSETSFMRESSAEAIGQSENALDPKKIELLISDDERTCCEDNEESNAIDFVMSNDNSESERLLVKKGTDFYSLEFWRRRYFRKQKFHIDAPILNIRDRASSSNKMLGTSQVEAGGGHNEENLRLLELESHLIETKSNSYIDRKMVRMEVMLTNEKEREDLQYEMMVQNMCVVNGEEPVYGYDNLGWYSTLTQNEDGEDDLDYLNSYSMNVTTEGNKSDDESNRWLDMAGNVALFILAPDLYFVNQMNKSSLYPQYQVTSNKKEHDKDTAQKSRWDNFFSKKKENEEDKTS